jgi:hypothetical protein
MWKTLEVVGEVSVVREKYSSLWNEGIDTIRGVGFGFIGILWAAGGLKEGVTPWSTSVEHGAPDVVPGVGRRTC